MLFAMTKQLTVVGEPSITSTATSLSCVNPSQTAAGRNMAQNTTSLKAAATSAGLMRENAFL
jgi:hypothetical protein